MTADRTISWSERAYTLLLHLLPRDFRHRYGGDMGELFRDLHRTARRDRGTRGVAALWLRQIPDLFATAGRLYVVAARTAIRRWIIPETLHASSASKGDGMWQSFAQDVRYGVRTLRRIPVFTGVVALVVALGVGAVTTVYSAANAIVLRPIPGVRSPDALVDIYRSQPGGRGTMTPSYPYFRAMRERTRTLDGLAAWSIVNLTVSDSGDGIAAFGNIVSANYFTVLGVKPALGRFFLPEEDRTPGNAAVVVLGHGFWQRRFAADPQIVGRTITVNGHPFTVVGVAPREFVGLVPLVRADAWVPLMMQQQVRGSSDLLSQAGSGWLTLVGRISNRVDIEAVRTELNALSAQYAGEEGKQVRFLRDFTMANVQPASGLPGRRGPAVAFTGLLLAVSALVMLIASSNVGGMLLARAVTRRREIAVRLALGASRMQLVRQLLTESVMLFLLGAGGGIALAWWMTTALARWQLPVGAEVPITIDVTPDVRVLLFALGSALVAGLVFGLAPALQSSRGDVASVLRTDSAGGGSPRSRMRNILVTAQIAMSLLLLMSAGLFARALQRGQLVDTGFSVDQVATATFDLQSAGYDEPRSRQFLLALRERLSGTPGVRAVSYTRMLPLTMSSSGTDIQVDGTVTDANDRKSIAFSVVDRDYFAVTQMPIVRGRGFEVRDGQSASRVAVVNEAFVATHWPNSDPVGRTFRYDSAVVTVVGVARNAKYTRLNEDLRPFLYLPLAQHWQSDVTLLVRTSGDPRSVAPSIRSAMQSLDRLVPPPNVVTLRQVTAVALLPQRIASAVSASLGMIGLLLAAVGLYGVIAFTVSQRTREIGIRMALGARGGDVVGLMIREGMRFAGVGIAVGIVLAAVLTRAMRPFLFGVSPLDPLTFVAIPAALAIVALIASWIPARRAAGMDPAATLRSE